MKVKEALTNEFKKNEYEEKGILLREKDTFGLIEYEREKHNIKYSRYLFYDEKYNWPLMEIYIPDPTIKDEYKDILLKYQHGIRYFMENLFDVFVGDKDDIEPMYTVKQKKDFTYKKSEDKFGSILVHLQDGRLFGIISFSDYLNNKNKDIVENFIKYFEGIPITKTWREICGL